MITAQRKGEKLEVEFCGKTEEIVAEYVAIISGFQERFGKEVATFITAKGLHIMIGKSDKKCFK